MIRVWNNDQVELGKEAQENQGRGGKGYHII